MARYLIRLKVAVLSIWGALSDERSGLSFVSTSYLRTYFEKAAESRTDIPITLLKTATKTITGGSVVHRLDDHVTKRGTLNNIRPNVTPHIYFSTDRMGRFSRGQDNYNLHFQGAIHLGIVTLSMCAFRNLKHVTGCILTYRGQCCEEKLEDVCISNQYPPPMVPNCKGNPLLYAEMHHSRVKISAGSRSFIRFTKTNNPAHAVAYLVLERILVASCIIILGPVERLQPIVGLMSVGEVLGVGIKTIINARYLFLLLPFDRKLQDEVLASLDVGSFQELAMICLLPEVLPQFHEFIGENFVANLFTQPKNICVLLKHLVVSAVMDLVNSPAEKIATTTTTHFTSRVGVARILYM
jgi:hypothetical protein